MYRVSMEQALTDLDLIQKAQGGDRDAFHTLYNRYKRPVLNYVYRLLGSRPHAEDVTQEAFVKVYMNLATFVPKGKVSSWIYAIAGNLAKNELRAGRHFFKRSIDEPASDDGDGSVTFGDMLADDTMRPDTVIGKRELRIKVAKALRGVPFKYRQVLALCDIQGLSYEEAGEALECAEGTIASRLSRARAHFIAHFKEGYV